ncbi:MAG: PEP-CTERM sorting domain-containing protein [Phycisphaerales bacterium]|nr:PEP-CTERM sorting domain-containing protein [Phycisphaerales bacterium]
MKLIPMMKSVHFWMAVGCAVFWCTTTSHAALQTQVFPFDYAGGPFPEFTIDKFDSMGGTRTLTGVTIELDGTTSLDVQAENFSNAPVTDWFVDFAVFPRLEILDAKKTSFPLGTAGFPHFEADFAPSDGIEGSGDDFVQFPTAVADIHADIEVFPADFPIFQGGGSSPALLTLPFSIAIPPGPIGFDFSRRDVGTVSLTYEYVPEPSTFALLTLGGVLITRRRRGL